MGEDLEDGAVSGQQGILSFLAVSYRGTAVNSLSRHQVYLRLCPGHFCRRRGTSRLRGISTDPRKG